MRWDFFKRRVTPDFSPTSFSNLMIACIECSSLSNYNKKSGHLSESGIVAYAVNDALGKD